MKIRNLLFFILVLNVSCKSYRENVMFRVEPPITAEFTAEEVNRNYEISPNDKLIIDIYTGKGERLIDPDRQLPENQLVRSRDETEYLVRNDGYIDLPMIGKINLSGLTIEEATEQLKDHYTIYYKDPYVMIRYVNKRVIVLGAMGSETSGQVILLKNDQVRVSEILALAGGLKREANAGNIRLLRGEQVRILNFSTFEGYVKDNIVVESGDIIYVEPVRRPVSEFLRENYPLIGITTGIISLIAVIISLNN